MHKTTLILKLISFGVNFVLWVLGLVILFVGVWIRSDQNFWEYQDNLPIGNYYAACYTVIIIGALLLMVGFMGCVGTMVDSPCILIAFICSMVFFILLECVAAGLVWKTPDGDVLQVKLRDWIMDKLLAIYDDASARRFMDLLQIHLQCCGATSKHDYEAHSITIPQSCSNYRTNNIYIYGCSENLRVHLQRTGAAIGGLAVGMAFFELIAIASTLLLMFNIRNEYSVPQKR